MRSATRKNLAAAIWIVVAALSGCHSVRTPLGVAERYVRAAEAHRPTARRWLLPPARNLDDKALIAELRASALGAAFAARIETRTARLPAGSEEPLALVLVDGQYRLARDPLDAYPRTTAEQCLRSFLRAIDAKRYERLAEFVPERYRSVVDARSLSDRLGDGGGGPLADLVGLLRNRLDQPLEYFGPNEARLLIDERRVLRLTRQPSGWIVESFD